MSRLPPVWLNGRLVPAARARVSALDHGLLYGDGLFETLRVRDGRVFRLGAHLDRLAASAARLSLPLPWTRAELIGALAATAEASGLPDVVLRLTITRGAGPPVPDRAGCPLGAATCLVTARPAPLPPGEDGLSAAVSLAIGGHHPRWLVPAVKSLAYLPFQQARLAARSRGFDEGLLCFGDEAVEASASNLFVARGGTVRTPLLAAGCLPGVARAAVLELGGLLGIKILESPVGIQEVEQADELFLTNSVLGIVPVSRFEEVGLPGPAGTLTRRLGSAWHDLTARESRAWETWE